jgi:predicted Holliday junction resolvase-like endonuclease
MKLKSVYPLYIINILIIVYISININMLTDFIHIQQQLIYKINNRQLIMINHLKGKSSKEQFNDSIKRINEDCKLSELVDEILKKYKYAKLLPYVE